jgi:hypothetical protein
VSAAPYVTIHHQGAGVPNNSPVGPYTYWIGVDRWQRLRSVAESWATKYYNGVSLDICLSGDRTNIAVTDRDIAMIGEVFDDCLARGEVVAAPEVQAHRQTYPTQCPGDQTMTRWPDVVNSILHHPGPPAPTNAEALLTTVGDPNHAGGFVRPVPSLHCLLLLGGARLEGDEPAGAGSADRIWRSKDAVVIAKGSALEDQFAAPDGNGVFAIYSLGENDSRSYFVPWLKT